mmetsp:Transcript_109234/g.314610  ORF Transcript_109234/g.314610 Transcript_109234/m.314610 type:complete len:335 (+) Transcript_109234:811-1815(+)
MLDEGEDELHPSQASLSVVRRRVRSKLECSMHQQGLQIQLVIPRDPSLVVPIAEDRPAEVCKGAGPNALGAVPSDVAVHPLEQRPHRSALRGHRYQRAVARRPAIAQKQLASVLVHEAPRREQLVDDELVPGVSHPDGGDVSRRQEAAWHTGVGGIDVDVQPGRGPGLHADVAKHREHLDHCACALAPGKDGGRRRGGDLDGHALRLAAWSLAEGLLLRRRQGEDGVVEVPRPIRQGRRAAAAAGDPLFDAALAAAAQAALDMRGGQLAVSRQGAISVGLASHVLGLVHADRVAETVADAAQPRTGFVHAAALVQTSHARERFTQALGFPAAAG